MKPVAIADKKFDRQCVWDGPRRQYRDGPAPIGGFLFEGHRSTHLVSNGTM
jgi:hypothetical protein